VHRRALPQVEHPKLNASCVDGSAHQTTQRVDFPHKVSLGNAANCRVAAHLANRVEVGRQ
jgi:hypothetical protein